MKLTRWTMLTLLGIFVQLNAQAAQLFNGVCPTTLIFKSADPLNSGTIILSGSQGTAFNNQATAAVTLTQSNPTQMVYVTNFLASQSNSYTVDYSQNIFSFTNPLGTLTFRQLGNTCYTTNTPNTLTFANKFFTKLAFLNPLEFQFFGMIDGQNVVLVTVNNLYV